MGYRYFLVFLCTPAAMQLAIFENLEVLKGDGTLIAYEAQPGSGTIQKSCRM
jgi:hypothetical protein